MPSEQFGRLSVPVLDALEEVAGLQGGTPEELSCLVQEALWYEKPLYPFQCLLQQLVLLRKPPVLPYLEVC